MNIETITPKDLKDKKDAFIIDVRAEEKFQDYHIKGATNIPKNKIFELNEEALANLPKDKEIVVTCTTGNSAKKCAEILAEKDYNVKVLEGGITAWKEYSE